MADLQEGNPLRNVNDFKNNPEQPGHTGLHPVVEKRLREEEEKRLAMEKKEQEKVSQAPVNPGGVDFSVKKSELEKLVASLNEQFEIISNHLNSYGQDLALLIEFKNLMENRLMVIEQKLGINSSIHQSLGKELNLDTPLEKKR